VTVNSVLTDTLSVDLAITGISVLWFAAESDNNPAVFRLLIRKGPHMLVAEDGDGYTPLDVLEQTHVDRINHAELLSLTHACTAAFKRTDIFSLIRHCGISTPLADLLKPHVHLVVAAPPPRRPEHRRLPQYDPRSRPALPPVRPQARRAARHHGVHRPERGVLPEAMEYVGPNEASPEYEGWQMDELTALSRQNAELHLTVASLTLTVTSLTKTNASLLAHLSSN